MAVSTPDATSSASAFVTTFLFNGIIALLFVLLFLTLRPKYQRVYQPRSLPDVNTVRDPERTDEVPDGYFSWVAYLFTKPHSYLIQNMSLDGYFFVRYLIIFGSLSLIGCVILFPILLPVNAVRGRRFKGFERLAFSNVTNKNRFFAHVFLSWLYFGILIYTIYRELYYYVSMRQAIQTTPYYNSQVGSRTLILTEFSPPSNGKSGGIGDDEEEAILRSTFKGVQYVVLARDHSELQKLVRERAKVTKKYESALNKVVNKSVKVRRGAELDGNASTTTSRFPHPEKSDDDFEKYLKKRPTHGLGKIPLIGDKVDTLDYCPNQIGKLNSEIKSKQDNWTSDKKAGTCFLVFESQKDAQLAYQTTPAVLKRSSYDKRLIGYAPEDICWENLDTSKAIRKSKRAIGNAILTAMIIFWAIPVAAVGAISNINFLTEKVHFLRFINNMPSSLMGIITGLLPSIALAILMSLVPIFIKKVGRISGSVTRQDTELYCQGWYFAFQVVQVFLVTTLASSATSTVSAVIDDPDNAMILLSNNMPKASNFYITYFLLLGLLFPSGFLLQLVTLVLSMFLGKILDSTPRQKWNRYNRLSLPHWGVIYPLVELLVCIYITYSIISPMLLIFSSIALCFFSLAYLYNLNYVYGFSYDLKGRNYVRALFQIFVGLYLAEICLLGLFIMAKSWGPMVLNIIFMILTVVAHLYFKRRFLPLVDAIPLSVINHSEDVGNFVYPARDQGLSEVLQAGDPSVAAGDIVTVTGDKVVGLLSGLSGSKNPNSSAGPPSSSDQKQSRLVSGDTSESADKAAETAAESTGKAVDDSLALSVSKPSSLLAKIKGYFSPSTTCTYPLVKNRVPEAYNLPVNYESDYERLAYTDPCVTEAEPIIWVAKDPMGVSTKQIQFASKFGVQVKDENTDYDEKGRSAYTGNPPDFDPTKKT
ncbi:Phm7p Ecym_5329 [Eremothecium cymbalariae DBVPG|uniref:CSC1/OSCA1-like 7TM region domain-containing protein n=1 Tax=Eremothecium cymbalariae (strain CBS 270.75 / DBVPG 7215 / KCTC 17166 / NRRL Y-17582) TaxID=931890 RepID=I6NDE6_ERECY|nr:hypothetical protein Ecym_5329 [Eremothecium cymbalariae DBVPG\